MIHISEIAEWTDPSPILVSVMAVETLAREFQKQQFYPEPLADLVRRIHDGKSALWGVRLLVDYDRPGAD